MKNSYTDYPEILSTIVKDNKYLLNSADDDGGIALSNEFEEYLFDCYTKIVLLQHSIDRAYLSIEVLSSSHSFELANSNFNNSSFVSFSVENYIISSCSIYDRVLHFINALLNLGLNKLDTTHRIIVANNHVIRLNLDKNLKKIKKLLLKYSIIRNDITHNNFYYDEISRDLSSKHFINDLEISQGRNSIYPEAELEQQTKEYLDSKVKEFSKYMDNLMIEINLIYDIALVVYANIKKNLSESI